MGKVLISGGTGRIGQDLSTKLTARGYDVAILSRSRQNNAAMKSFVWCPEKNELEKEAIEWADYVIHLAGADISANRWTAKRKKEILDSRINSGSLLVKEINEQGKKIKAFITSSAIGYYGMESSEHIFTETDAPANDFLGQICKAWEQVPEGLERSDIRKVQVRTGVVLTRKGGALAKMSRPLRKGINTSMGTGKQYMPWIHIDDLSNIFIKAVDDPEMKGAYNAIAPEHIRNEAFTRILARVYGKRILTPKIPALAMKLLYGSMAQILLSGSRVSSDKIISSGFEFQFPDLEVALRDLIRI